MTLDQLIKTLNEHIGQNEDCADGKWFLTKTDEGIAWVAFVIDEETEQ